MPPRQCTKTKQEIANPCRRICLPIDREEYDELITNGQGFRDKMKDFLEISPKLDFVQKKH